MKLLTLLSFQLCGTLSEITVIFFRSHIFGGEVVLCVCVCVCVCVLTALGFDLRASHLLGRRSVTCTTLPA
jgi:hypothetical protein